MEINYIINSYFKDCYINCNGAKFSYSDLMDLLKDLGKSIIKKKTKEFKSIETEYREFEKSNLSPGEIQDFLEEKKKSKANSWLTKMRSLRRKGKLEKYKIDKLNELGMVWNPTTDEWEKMFLKFKKNYIKIPVELLIENPESTLSYNMLFQLNNLNKWINNQRELFFNKNLESENFLRLKAIKFPFEEDKNTKGFSVELLLIFISNIRELREDYGLNPKEFLAKYNISKKNNFIGSSVILNEKNILKVRNQEQRRIIEEDNLIDEKNKNFWNVLNKRAIEKVSNISENKHFENIDLIFKRKYSRKKDKYLLKYYELSYYLSDIFHYEENDYFLDIKFDYSNEVKLYASQKILILLDDFLLKNGDISVKSNFEVFKFLIKYHRKNRNHNKLIELKKIIEKHQALSINFSEKIKKALV